MSTLGRNGGWWSSVDARSDRGAVREAAQLRYELARLRDRRPVRAALALTELRRDGPARALRALRGELPRLDVPGPSTVPLRAPYPHLRVASTGAGEVVAGAAARERLTPTTAAMVLARDRPDVVLVDGLAGWDATTLHAAIRAARQAGSRVVTVGPDVEAAVPGADLRLRLGTDRRGGAASPSGPGGGAVPVLELAAAIDVRRWSPAGLDEAVPAHQRPPVGLGPDDARRQPVVDVRDVDAIGARRVLEMLSAGAVVVCPNHPTLAAAFAGLDAGTRDRVIGDAMVGDRDVDGDVDGGRARAGGDSAGDHGGRVAALLGDDELRRRTSVRLRRHVHAQLSTRAAVIALVTALGIDTAPDDRIGVLLATRRPDRVHQVLRELEAQRHPHVAIILLAHGALTLPDDLPGAELIRTVRTVAAERPLGAVLNVGLDLTDAPYIAKIDDDDHYGPDHLGDQLLALHHSGADAVGRRVHGTFHEQAALTEHPAPGGEERFEDHLPGATMLLPADVLRAQRWRHVPRGVDTELVRAIHLDGGSVYSSHRYGFVRVRHGDHTSDPALGAVARVSQGLATSLLEA